MDKKTLQQRIDALPKTDDRNEPYILKARRFHPRAYIKWEKEEDEILTELCEANYPIREIATFLKRSMNAIENQMERLLLNFPNTAERMEKPAEKPTSKINNIPFQPHKNPILNLIHYWRNSLADAEKMGIEAKRMKAEGKEFSWEAFQQGKLVWPELQKIFAASEKQRKKSVKNHSDDDIDEPYHNKLQVIIAPLTANKIQEHGNERFKYNGPSFVLPLWLVANITRTGELIPCETNLYPWIARECLTPNERRAFYPIIGDVSQVDDFYMHNKQLLGQENLQWETLLSFGFDLLQSLTNKKLEDIFLAQNYKLNWKGYILPFNDMQGSSLHITRTYDQYLFNENKKVPTLLQEFCSLEKREHIYHEAPVSSFIAEKSRRHLGQMQNQYPLSESQRVSLSYFFDDKESNNIFTVNGPPGTGKTSLLLSVIASKWVDAAIQRKMPPIIVAASTNNQAVTNILDCFNKSNKESLSDFSMRWLPNLTSYGLYLPSTAKIDEAQNNQYLYQTKEKKSDKLEYFYTNDYREQAKIYFLEKFNNHYKTQLSNIIDCQNHLHQKLLEKKALIGKTIELISQNTIYEKGIKRYGNIEIIHKMIGDYDYQETVSKTRLIQLNDLRKQWLSYKSEHLKWSFLPSWLPFTPEKLIAEKIQNFTLKYPDVFTETITSVKATTRHLDGLIKKQIQDHNQIQQLRHELITIKEAHDQFPKTKTTLQKLLGFDFKIDDLFDFSTANGLLSKLDLTLRYDLFVLATHYWEAAWLIESTVIQSLTNDRSGQEKYWQIQAMLLPCFVTTLHSGPAFFQYKNACQEFEVLSDFLDLLIIDEAGQVMPAIAGAMISIAKQIILVGDMKQIEPIFSLPPAIDIANAKKFHLCSEVEDYENLKECGILCSGDYFTNHAYGNVILVGQRKAIHYIQNYQVPGMLLKEHRRCHKKIISYCNELCYNNQLIPMTEEKPCPYPRMGYAHIKGHQQKSGSSRFNQDEAEVIAAWLAKNEEKILGIREAKSLDECVGIITPFFMQAEVIKAALKKYNLNIQKVGTIHSLQGAEKDIIIFSPVYTTEEQQIEFFFDRSPNMLNVAVSRAKMSFLVFGDMDIFDQSKGNRPSALLAKYLFADEKNEIVDIIPPQFTSLPAETLEPLDTLEKHQLALKESFSKAVNELNIVSPFLATAALESDKIPDLIRACCQKITINIYSDPTLNYQRRDDFTQAIEILKKAGANVMLVNNVHSKILAIDNRILISGSFNWLSTSRTKPRYEFSLSYAGNQAGTYIQSALAPIKNKVKSSKQKHAVSTASPQHSSKEADTITS